MDYKSDFSLNAALNMSLHLLQAELLLKSRMSLCSADGCSSHMTSVAVGALSGYMSYYLTEQDITKRPLS